MIDAYEPIDYILSNRDIMPPLAGYVITFPDKDLECHFIYADDKRHAESHLEIHKIKSKYPHSLFVRKCWIHYTQNRKYWSLR